MIIAMQAKVMPIHMPTSVPSPSVLRVVTAEAWTGVPAMLADIGDVCKEVVTDAISLSVVPCTNSTSALIEPLTSVTRMSLSRKAPPERAITSALICTFKSSCSVVFNSLRSPTNVITKIVGAGENNTVGVAVGEALGDGVVGDFVVGEFVGDAVLGAVVVEVSVGAAVDGADDVGAPVGVLVVGVLEVGSSVGDCVVGIFVGAVVGETVGICVLGATEGATEGVLVGP